MGRFSQAKRLGDQYYDMLPSQWRELDHSEYEVTSPFTGDAEPLLFHNRLLRVFGDAQEGVLTAVRGVLSRHDPLSCPVADLPYCAANLGWPLDTSRGEGTRRLMIRHIVELVYRGKHKLSDIEAAIEAVAGVNATVTAYNDPADIGIAGTSAADDGSVAGLSNFNRVAVANDAGTGFYADGQAVAAYPGEPSVTDAERALRFTFLIAITGAISAAQLSTVQFLADYMRPSREHYRIEVTP